VKWLCVTSAIGLILALGGRAEHTHALSYTYATGVQVINLEPVTASVILTFYDFYNTPTRYYDTISGSQSKTYYPLPAVNYGFQGSLIVTSNRKIAAIANQTRTSGIAGRASQVNPNQGALALKLPMLQRNHGTSQSSTWFSVQNAGSTGTYVYVTYTDGTQNGANILPGASAIFDQLAEWHNATLFAGSVTNTGNQPLVVTVVSENAGGRVSTYPGFGYGDSNLAIPMVRANTDGYQIGYQTGIQIQNGGAAYTYVTVSYYPAVGGAGSSCQEIQTILAGESKTFALNAFVNGSVSGGWTNCAAGQTFVGSALVTSNSGSQPLYAIVNQTKGNSNSGAYGAFSSSSTSVTSKVSFPLIKKSYGTSNGTTTFMVMNVGSATVYVYCTFTGASYTTGSYLSPGQAFVAPQAYSSLPVSYVGGAVCDGGASAKLVGAIYEEDIAVSGDMLLTTEGINTN